MGTLKDNALLKEQCYINGKWVSDKETHSVVNPFNQATIASVPSLSSPHIDQAIEGAYSALTTWKKTPAPQRSKLLARWYQLICQYSEKLAEIITSEQGKPLSEAKGEVQYAASFVDWYAQEAVRIYGETIPAATEHAQIQVKRQPVGVVAAITPWNFPAAMVTRKLAPALAAGCTVVLKPALIRH